MLWYKDWLETRWRFFIGLALLTLSSCAVVFEYPRVMRELLPLLPKLEGSQIDGLRNARDIVRSYSGYVWSTWFRQGVVQTWSIFAVVLGAGGLLSRASRGGALYTLSMPASRARLLGVRAATGLGELLVLAIVPSLVIPVLSPLVSQTYSVGDVLVYGACLWIGGSVFFSLAFLLSTVFSDVWRPPLIAICVAFGMGALQQVFHDALPSSLSFVMNAESYFRGGGVPWIGLLVRIAVSAGLLYGAVLNIERQDF